MTMAQFNSSIRMIGLVLERKAPVERLSGSRSRDFHRKRPGEVGRMMELEHKRGLTRTLLAQQMDDKWENPMVKRSDRSKYHQL